MKPAEIGRDTKIAKLPDERDERLAKGLGYAGALPSAGGLGGPSRPPIISVGLLN